MVNDKIKIENETRGCIVKGEPGYFHVWEFYSVPVEASPLTGGAPAGVFSRMYGIVEFSDCVRRVEPTDIIFCDEENSHLYTLKKLKEKTENE